MAESRAAKKQQYNMEKILGVKILCKTNPPCG